MKYVKKIFAFILSAILILTYLPAVASAAADYTWYDGKASPFTISNAGQLKGLADIVNGDHGTPYSFYNKVVNLTADLNLSGYVNWTPIGFNNQSFAGTFNGNGHTISGLTIDASGRNYVGLFGLMSGGSVSDLYLSNVNITGGQNVGGIVGEVWGSVSRCAVTGGTVSGNSYVGGIAGKVNYNTSSLTGCFATCNVRGIGFSPYSAGGVAGRVEYGGRLTDCYATGSVKTGEGVSGIFEGAGGVAGTVNGGNIQRCFATGEVAGTTSIGGVAGALNTSYGDTTLNNCAALNNRVAGASDAGMYGGPNTGRVVGRVAGDSLVTNTIAFSGMIVVNAGGSKVDGTAKSGTEIKAEGFFEANGFLSAAWQNGTESLPILVSFPGGLQSGELPAHIGSPTPTAPLSLAATPNSGSVNLSWAAPGSSGADVITRYEVQKDTGGWISAGMSLTYTFSGLTNGTIYTFEVRAVNSYGNGAAAAIQRVPVSPGNVAAIPGDRSVVLNWVTSSAQVGFYQVRYNAGAWIGADSDYMHTFIGLANGEQYTFEVRGLAAVSPFSVLFTDSVISTPVGIPWEPTNLAAVPGNGQIVLSWDAPISDEGSPILRYEVSRDGGDSWVSVGVANTHTLTGLTNGTTYSLKVRAVNAVGTGSSVTDSATPRQPPVITSANSHSLTYGSGGTFAVTVSGMPPFTYALSDQPAGVSINSTTGQITIEKTVPVDAYTFTIMVTNGSMPDAAQSFTLNIAARTPLLGDLLYTASSDRTYSGAGSGIGPVTDKNAIGLSITVYYQGISGTTYPRSATPPKNTGTYEAIAGIASNANINNAELSLGTYRILPKSITVTPTTGQNKVYGQADPVLQYTLSDTLFAGDALTGALVRAAGENVGAYNIAVGTITGGSNYTLSLSDVISFTINSKATSFTVAGISPLMYTGSAITPEPQVKDGSTVLTKNVHYTYSYSNNTNAGTTAAVSVTGIGNYAGSTGSATFTIDPKSNAAFTIAGITPLTYTGNAITPEPIVKDGSTILTKNVHYTYGYSDNTSAGTSAAVTITGIGNYAGSTGSTTFTINPKNNATFTIEAISPRIYTGSTINPEPQVKDGGTVLIKNVDFTYGYSNNSNAGASATVSITGVGNYAGSSGSATFIINSKADAAFTIAEISPQTYTGSAINPEPQVEDGGTALIKNVDFTFGYSNNTNAGTSAAVTINGIGNYAGSTGSATFIINPKADAAFTIAEITPLTYTGNAITPEPIVKDGSTILTKNVHYTYAYSDNTSAGTSAAVTITGIGNYAGSTGSTTFTINPKNNATFTIEAISPRIYTGSAINPEPQVKDGGTVLIRNVDFTYGYSNNSNAGASATVSITGIGNYAGSSSSATFTIEPKNDATFTIEAISPRTYTGSAINPEPQVEDGGTALIKNVDFTYGYSNNTNTGASAAVTITGIANYAGSTGTATFTIDPKDNATFTIEAISPQTYTGSAINPEPQIKDWGTALIKNVDFTYGYSNNTNAGTSATVTITGIGNYEGSTGSATFTIDPKADATFTITGTSPQIYSGSAINPEPQVKDGSAALTKNVDFTYGYSNNTSTGASATISITGIGNYAGSTGSATFTIIPATPNIITPPTVIGIVLVGARLSKIKLAGGEASVGGHFEWVNPSAVAVLGQNSYEARFVPDDAVLYTQVEGMTVTFTAFYPPNPYVAKVKTEDGTEKTLPVTSNKNTATASVDIGAENLTSGEAVITIPPFPGIDTYSVGIPVPELSKSDDQSSLTIKTDAGNVTIPSDMLTGINNGNKAEITIGQGDKDSLPDNVKSAIGGRPLISLTLSIDGKQTVWSNPDAPVTVAIPYTPTAAELNNQESIVIWYIDGTGNVVTIPNGHFDPATGLVTFYTTHFSNYAVAYYPKGFNDIPSGAWYNEAVDFIAAREITSGTGDGNYSPGANLTRGEFIVMIMRAYSILPELSPTDNFNDADDTYYTGYLAAAKHLGISAGIGNNLYAPNKEISRQEMFTLLYNALNVIGQLPQGQKLHGGDSGKTLPDFTDSGQIDTWAKEAMTLLVEIGIVVGSAGKLTPHSITTRAEFTQILFKLLTLD